MNKTLGTLFVLLLSTCFICQVVETESAARLCNRKTCRDNPPFYNGKGRCARSGHLKRCVRIGSSCRCKAENTLALLRTI